ncbi:efflux RND transporter periplasmic adaptor subunit [Tindallia californiensis]|uniref:RND family efflux transporter, MFP subunit n=1 Tax=Tindallia californiensis TaxID=159292 RepID=A0A1H3M8P9_9FIRM|nr:efflux RND transporter periplasmic adaptor subunit [Tindallia californiensis]SDY73090.1 RND family efflux transporter, MFP subunit [Tindallia californiensis]
MNKKAIIAMLVIVTLVAGLLVLRLGGRRGIEDAPEEVSIPVEVQTSKRETISDRVVLNGRIEANDEAMVMPLIQGKVNAIPVVLGEIVEKDQTLMVIDQANSLRSLEQAEKSLELAQQDAERAEAGVEQALLGVENAEDQHADAQANLERVRSLYNAGAASQTELEQAELAANSRQVENARSQLRQAEVGYQQALNQVAQAEIGYRQAADALEDTIVKAPMSGVVSSLTVVAGEMAGGSQPVAIISDIEKVYFQANVAENIINSLRLGQDVTITIPAAELEIEATLDFISSTINPETNLYKVRAYLENEDYQIRTGMSATVETAMNTRENVAVNRRSVIERDGETYVFVIEGESAKRKDVTLGMESEVAVEIIEGIEEGETIVVKGQHYLADGDKIRVVGGE